MDYATAIAALRPTEVLVSARSPIALFMRHKALIVERTGLQQMQAYIGSLQKTNSYRAIQSNVQKSVAGGAMRSFIDALKTSIETGEVPYEEHGLGAAMERSKEQQLVAVDLADLALVQMFCADIQDKFRTQQQEVARQAQTNGVATPLVALLRHSTNTDRMFSQPLERYARILLPGGTLSQLCGPTTNIQERVRDGSDQMTLARLALMLLNKFFLSHDSPSYWDHCWLPLDNVCTSMLVRLVARQESAAAARPASKMMPVLAAYGLNETGYVLAVPFGSVLSAAESLFVSTAELRSMTDDDVF